MWCTVHSIAQYIKPCCRKPEGERITRELLRRRNRALEECLTGLEEEEVVVLDRVLGKLLATLADQDEVRAFQICCFCDGETCDPCPVEDSF